ncbi:protein NO VEIN domain-containing protein [Pedobacter arcticus]|uniref:protein NO VEIN domain-containing protein n=1 Tax=Pedobacter arcticus TaxID=752140 RepID=UPI00031C28AC|nr:DUF3883 domain-containing protein [Pedobacter arcticus]
MYDFLEEYHGWLPTGDPTELERRKEAYKKYMDENKAHNVETLRSIFDLKVKSLLNVIAMVKPIPDFENSVFDRNKTIYTNSEIGHIGERKVNDLIDIVDFKNIFLPNRMGASTLKWPNRETESYLPYDIEVKVLNTYLGESSTVASAYFDVKTTFGSFDNSIYLSATELFFFQNVISNKGYYIIARVYSSPPIEKSFRLANNLFVKFILIDSVKLLNDSIRVSTYNSYQLSPKILIKT